MQGHYGSPPAGPPPSPSGPGPGAPRSDDTTLVILLGVSSIFVMFFGCLTCGPLCLASLGLSIPAMVIARRRLADVDAGLIPESSRQNLQLGFGIGVVTAAMTLLAGVLYLIVFALYGGMIGLMLLNPNMH